MKNKHITIVFIAFFLVILSSCNWLFPKCEGYYLYEITDYKKIDYCYLLNPENGEFIKIETDNFIAQYNKLFMDISPSLKEIGITEQCSYMEHKVVDKIEKFNIYANNDYNENFPINTNLNKLFATNGDTTVYEELQNNTLSTGLSLSLNYPPSQQDTFIFNIHIELNDGKTFDLESRPIIITP